MEPAQTIIERLGGPGTVAGIVNIHRTRVSNWKRSRTLGGTDGLIPQRYHRVLLDYAEQNSIPLAAEEFLPPRALAEPSQVPA